MKMDRKLELIRIRIAPDDKQLVKKLAKKRNMNMSDYLRALILEDLRSNIEVLGGNK